MKLLSLICVLTYTLIFHPLKCTFSKVTFQNKENITIETNLSSGKAKFYRIEKHKRIAFPFAIIILSIIAVALSSKKVKGGIGMNLGLGLLISFSYILFFQFSSTLAINGDLKAWIAVWIPNFLYIILGILFLRRTQNN